MRIPGRGGGSSFNAGTNPGFSLSTSLGHGSMVINSGPREHLRPRSRPNRCRSGRPNLAPHASVKHNYCVYLRPFTVTGKAAGKVGLCPCAERFAGSMALSGAGIGLRCCATVKGVRDDLVVTTKDENARQGAVGYFWVRR